MIDCIGHFINVKTKDRANVLRLIFEPAIPTEVWLIVAIAPFADETFFSELKAYLSPIISFKLFVAAFLF